MVDFTNIKFVGLSREILLKEEDQLKIIVTANAEIIVRANEIDGFRYMLNNSYTTFDGQIPFFLARLRFPNVEFEKISGSDFIYDACRFASREKKRIFLLGGEEKSNNGSIEKIRKDYGVDIDGYSPPFKPYPFDEEHNRKILNKISEFRPDFLFVGFGAVKQESWIYDNKEYLESLGVKWAIGSGGTFEFVAGKIKRAPKIIQKIGLEGIWRLLAEPRWFRLKRIFISLKIFYYIIFDESGRSKKWSS